MKSYYRIMLGQKKYMQNKLMMAISLVLAMVLATILLVIYPIKTVSFSQVECAIQLFQN
jgi:hypothetical protein